jgi:hypothetical protein
MRHRHFRQAENNDQGGKSGDRIADDDGGTGIADRDTAAHEQPGADRAAEADHHGLCLGQAFVKAPFAIDDRRVIRIVPFGG